MDDGESPTHRAWREAERALDLATISWNDADSAAIRARMAAEDENHAGLEVARRAQQAISEHMQKLTASQTQEFLFGGGLVQFLQNLNDPSKAN